MCDQVLDLLDRGAKDGQYIQPVMRLEGKSEEKVSSNENETEDVPIQNDCSAPFPSAGLCYGVAAVRQLHHPFSFLAMELRLDGLLPFVVEKPFLFCLTDVSPGFHSDSALH